MKKDELGTYQKLLMYIRDLNEELSKDDIEINETTHQSIINSINFIFNVTTPHIEDNE